MPPEIDHIGAEWLIEEAEQLTDHIEHVSPVAFNEENRYLPESVTSMPGYIRYDVNPFMREILECADIDSPVREVAVKKGVQITYTTLLESIAFYYMGHVKTLPMMFATADKELSHARIENNFIPMLTQSGFDYIIQSADITNKRKTGKTSKHIQFQGGGYLVPVGAKNANKLRSYSICVMLQDEIDAWDEVVGKDGDPVKLLDDRCSGYWERRIIFRGSTPLIHGTSKIDKAYERGDQRKYNVLCKHCGFPQPIRWSTEDKNTGIKGGFTWELDEHNGLILESIAWCCAKCGRPHYEADKTRLFSPDHGAKWIPTAKPVEPNVRSYHLPAFYSPIGMAPWYKCVLDNFAGQDPVTGKVIDIGKYQIFYNNILARSFKVLGDRVSRHQVSFHRRAEYRLGQIPNRYAEKYSGSKILFLTCQVDVHKSNLAVTVMGWCKGSICYVIDYWRMEAGKDASEISDPVWPRLHELIEQKEYVSDDGHKYRIIWTFIDAGYANDTVTQIASVYESGVYPTLGRDRPSKNQKISEFAEFTTNAGTTGYKILVDHYKDRLAPVLRREWHEADGLQPVYHFNTPIDTTEKQLLELTKEVRKQITDDKGVTTYVWYRPGNAPNEFWDLLVLGHAAVEVIAYKICIEHFELKSIDWVEFWRYIENEKLYFTEA